MQAYSKAATEVLAGSPKLLPAPVGWICPDYGALGKLQNEIIQIEGPSRRPITEL